MQRGFSNAVWVRRARWTLALAGAALLIASALAGPARPLLAQDQGSSVAPDRAALMALYAATGGPNWKNNTNWGSSAPLGAWQGVTTDALGRVTHLNLQGNNLTGQIPAALSRLSHLRYLHLGSNRLSGELPAVLGDLPNLTALTVGGNHLRGDLPAEWGKLATLEKLLLHGNSLSGPLPPEWGQLAALRALWLSGNHLNGPIPREWNRLTNLETLLLGRNQLSGSLPDAFRDLIHLEHLSLEHNRLSGPLPPAWGQLDTLLTLNLQNNELSGPLPPAWSRLANLETLWLQDNELHGSLPPEWSQLVNLKWLGLGDNELSGPLPSAWGQLVNLTFMHLEGNRLSGSIPAEWGQLARLKRLWLNDNQLHGSIPAELTDLSSLESLRLGGNPGLHRCLSLGWRAWLAGLASDPSLGVSVCLLRDLRLRGAALVPPFAAATDAYRAAVADDVVEVVVTATPYGANDRLTVRKGGRQYASGETLPLDPGPNHITIEVVSADAGGPVRVIVAVTVTRGGAGPTRATGDRAALLAFYEATDGPNWTTNANWGSDAPLGDWHGVNVNAEGRVTGLRLERNNLTGTLPGGLGNLTALEDLNLSSNQLHGPVFPPRWADLLNLRTLRLGSNQFSGPIPPALGNLSNLRILDAASNQLRGPIPPALGNLSNLRILDAASNQLRGPIPPALGNLPVWRLWLDRNQLSGPIPAALGNLPNVRELRLGHNQLSGPIPPELSNLPKVESLDLDDNQLSGPIPVALANFLSVKSLSLGNNQLSGPIPPELGSIPTLTSLDLANNQLHGLIPSELGRLANLWSLFLYGNQLSGPIPAELGNIPQLRTLWLSHNQLSGPIPPELGSLPLLWRLYLSNNHLSEPIPAALGRLPRLEDLFLQNNQLSGPIPEELSDLPSLRRIRLAGNPGLRECLSPDLRDWLADVDHDVPTSSPSLCLLRDLQLSGTALHPPFAATTDAYTAAVAGPVEEIVVRATLHDANDTVTIRKGARTYANGAAVPLARGTNLITVEVTPADHTYQQIVIVMVTRARTDPIALPLRAGGDLIVIPAGVAATAADLFGGTDVASVWLYGQRTRAWDDSYFPSRDRDNFAITGGDVLWVVTPMAQTLVVQGTPPAPDPGPIALTLRQGGDIVAVPAGRPTTAADLFGGTDVASVWKYNRAARLWDLSYLPAPNRGDFPIAPGDALWVVSPRAQTIPDMGGLPAQDPGPAVEADRAALMALYEATDGLYWRVNTNWGSEALLGAWHGVTTDGDGRVIRLYLYLNRLIGPIPPELGHLANLETLDLGNNQLQGPIPPELGHLTNLRDLDLGNNQLQGPVPAAPGHLANLQHLDLGNNQLQGPVPAALGHLANLQHLDLGNNQLQGPVPAALGNLANLQHLDLGRNRLSGPLPTALGNLVNLKSLMLEDNELSGPLPATLGNLANLQHLDLGQNRLSGPLPAALGNLTNLQHLDLGQNRLSGPLPATLGNLANLRRLDLLVNWLSGLLPTELGNLINLRSIKLEYNPLTGCVPHRLRHLAAQGQVTGFSLANRSPPVFFCLLRDLQLEGAILEPPFSDGTDNYTAAVGRSVVETAVTATLHDAGDRLTIHKGGEIYANGAAVPLDPGPNIITIEMIPADGTPPHIVTVTVTRGGGP